MPIYCYQCKKCKVGFEKLMKMSDSDKVPECPNCGSKEDVKKQATTGNVHYKGSGFYTTDYGDKMK
jgi:putative FmdB family regulatory protein